MKIVRWVALFTGVTLMWTFVIVGGMFLFNDVESVVEAEPVVRMAPLPHREHQAPAPCCTELPLPAPPPEEVEEVNVVHRHVEPRRTAVQEAAGFYVECFGEPNPAWRRCRRLFNRTISETELMRRYRESTPGLPDVTRLVLGRIILSEANWPHDERRDRYFPEQNHAEIDAPAIYQVLRHTRRRGETLLGAMRRHSPHVSEAVALEGRHLERRMAWITQLQLSCDRPSRFPATDRQGNAISWDDDGYRERCENLFVLAQRLIDGDADALGPWTHAPLVTWGGRCETEEGACDDSLGYARGLVPFETGDTANRFWCRPGAVGCPVPTEAEEPATTEVETETASDGLVASEGDLGAST